MATPLRKTGIGLLDDFSWGTHFCHFFETKQDLLDTLLPYFAAGLEERERCLWLVAEPLTTDEAESALRRSVPDLDRHLTDGSIEIRPAREWYLRGDGLLDLGRVIRAWDEKLAQALARGFAGLRVNAGVSWLSRKDWRTFSEYEARFNQSIGDKRMVVLCTYPLATSGAAEILDVARTHQFALAKRNGGWEIVETPELRQAKDEIKRLNEELQGRVVERTRQLEAVNEELRARNRQQSAVAALGQTAIRARDLSGLIDEAAAVAAETLGTDYSAVLELLPSGEELLLRAGVGWKEGLVGRHTVPTAIGTAAGLILRSDTPIVVPDLRQEKRFTRPPSLLEHGVISAMDVLIRGRASPWGSLCVHTTRPRSFSPDDVGFLQSVANILALAVERDGVERAQQREKETLEAIFDNIPVMISSFDASGRLLRVNREWEGTLGWTLAEAQRVDVLAEAYPDPEDRKEVVDFIRRAERRWADFRMRTRSGRVIESSWARFELSDGSRIGFGLDVSERKQAEEALRESEGRFRQLAESESRARTQAEAALERLRAIESITDAALSYLGLDDLLRELLARLRSTLQAEIASVRLIGDEGKELYARAIDGIPLERVAGIGIPLDAVHLDAPFMVNEIQPPAPGRDDWFAKTWAAMGMPLRAGMSTPLVVEGKPIGIVGVTSTRAPFTEADLHLLQVVADRVAPAIERGQLLERVRAGRERQNVLSRRLLTAQEEERRRIAVELHDELGQVLTAVKINLESLERLAGSTAAPAQLKSAIGCVDEAMQRVRDLALDLRPSVLDDLGLPAALRWYVDRFARDAHLEAHLTIGAVPRLDPALETACFRVAQEAVTNVARHAQARRVWLDLHLLAEGLELGVRDDGIGFEVAAARERAALGASMGLLGMEEHVSLVGGEYEVRSTPGGGTRVRARFPVGRKSA